jgi:hypothetical protein
VIALTFLVRRLTFLEAAFLLTVPLETPLISSDSAPLKASIASADFPAEMNSSTSLNERLYLAENACITRFVNV